MRHFFLIAFLGCLLIPAWAEIQPESESSSDYVIAKVNHEFIDKDGYTTLEIGDLVRKARYQGKIESDRDIQGMRFVVHWKAPSSRRPQFTVQVQARGVDFETNEETLVTVQQHYTQTPNFSGWTFLDIKGRDFKRLGKLMAWKATLLQNYKVVASRHSFTWDDTILTSQHPNETK